MIFGTRGPPSSAPPSAGMYRRDNRMTTLQTAPIQKMTTLNPSEPESTGNGWPWTHGNINIILWTWEWCTQWRRQRSKTARSFRGQKSQVTRMHFFPQKVDDLFIVVALKTQAPTPFHRRNKTNEAVRYGNIFIFCSHYNTEAKQYGGLGRAEPGLEPERWIFQPPGAPWCCVTTGCTARNNDPGCFCAKIK